MRVAELYEKILPVLHKQGFNENKVDDYSVDDWIKFEQIIPNIQVKEDDDMKQVRVLVNLFPGPKVLPSEGKGYGLFADRQYGFGDDLSIEYGGEKVSNEFSSGDYVLYSPSLNITVDGARDFYLNEKGRWINEEKPYNVTFSENMSKKRNKVMLKSSSTKIKKEQELSLYYGPDYERPWKQRNKRLKCFVCKSLTDLNEEAYPHRVFCGKKCQKEYYQ